MATYTTRNNLEKPAAADTGFPYTVNDNMDLIDDRIAKCNFSAATDPAVSDDSSDGYSVGSKWWNTTGHKLFVAEDVTVGAAVWRQVWPALVADMTGLIKSDGTIALSANWDAGAHEIRAETLEADVATGTAPLTIASTTKVTNLNADQVDGIDIPLTADVDFGSYQVKALKFESDQATGTAPLVVASTTKVANLNCDKLDDLEGAAYAVLAGQSGGQTLEGDTASGGNLTLSSTHHATKGRIIVPDDLEFSAAKNFYLSTTGSLIGFGCYWDAGWRRTIENKGGSIIRNSDGEFDVWAGPAATGAVGSKISGFASVFRIEGNGGVAIGSATHPGAGNLYVVGDVNCASVTDHTPAYAGDAVSEIKAIKSANGQIDHASLPKFCQKKYADAEGEKIGRDLGATISILVEAVRQLTTRIEKLEAGGKNGVRRH